MDADLTEIRQRIATAYTEISELAEQGVTRRWRMHIPAQPDRDSDLLISRALNDAEVLADEVERLRVAADPKAADAVRNLIQSVTRLVTLERDDARKVAEQAEDLLRVAHDTSNRSEAERASAAAEVERVRVLGNELVRVGSPLVADIARRFLAALDHPTDTTEAATGWQCPRCGSPKWVAASLTGPVAFGGRAIKQCVPCGHYSNDPATGETETP